ncbi:V-type proton ATPase 16 kDa proteolipid subunit c-like [Argiope bruennichi]|uniref:V-type proton ATPase proteolipid subunit n=1 Tax=Argiope bruennichi TaxID=94029 RepID=A0A8T0FWX4_ARGBR|nr:V-type proton ATPase 16 kDa proteolipid subunit c-like [Argiope bruennichi]KAF8794149.1 V-type proton ATPase 16 kDa proteolipid like protein [Argiope bruennichi]
MAHENVIYGSFFGSVGATLAMSLTALGAAYGTAKAGVAISTAGTFKPNIIMKSLIPVVMAGVLAIYGLVAAVLISYGIESASKGYSAVKGYLALGCGISVGMTGVAAGYAIGIVGDCCVRECVHQEKLFIGMVLILIFCEVIGLYGLIVGLMLTTKGD